MPGNLLVPAEIRVKSSSYTLGFFYLNFEVRKELPVADSSQLFISPAIPAALGNLSRQLTLNHLLEDFKGLGTHDCDPVDEKGGRRTYAQVCGKFKI